MVTVQPDLIHDAYVEPNSPASLRVVPDPAPSPPHQLPATVWVSPGVAGYHLSSQCSALLSDLVTGANSVGAPFRMDRTAAEENGIEICKWCRAWQQML